jgi:serine/threonine protein kinase
MLVGSILPGRFRIDGLIARGGFGTVYRARQLSVERDVAVKILHADIDPSSPGGRLFVHEIQSVGRIDHPNVVRIYQDRRPDVHAAERGLGTRLPPPG